MWIIRGYGRMAPSEFDDLPLGVWLWLDSVHAVMDDLRRQSDPLAGLTGG